MTHRRPSMDWMLKDLADGVPGTRHVVVLTADGLRMAQHATDDDTADRLAAACAGLQSLSGAIAAVFPHGDRKMRLVVIEAGGGFFYLMAAGSGAFLAVLADEGVDAGLMGQQMRDLVARIGDHLTSAPRADAVTAAAEAAIEALGGGELSHGELGAEGLSADGPVSV